VIIGLWAVLIFGGEIVYRYFQCQEALSQLETSYPPSDPSMHDAYFRRRDRILDRMGPFVSAQRKQAVRDKRPSSGALEPSRKD
jgi:hypothetical protein